MTNSFGARQTLDVKGKQYEIYSVAALNSQFNVDRLPYSLKILLENQLRTEDGHNVTRAHIEALAKWDPQAEPSTEIAFTPARVVMQDFTGVPAVVDLAAMRDAMTRLGGDPRKINPLSPAELVIDHSVMVDYFGRADAPQKNAQLEFERNGERYVFLRWGQGAFSNFKVVPPDTGIVHQVNLEYLARVVFSREVNGVQLAYPDTLVGTDSHTTMVNGLGVLGWGVGGIEAEAAMLGQPISMLIPQVVGFRLKGKLPQGSTATDLVLTVTQMLRQKGVVGKFVEFFGDGLDNLKLADRATISNMSPEYGATCGIFPYDDEVLAYLRLTGRTEEQIDLVEQYAKATGMWREKGQREADYTAVLELDMGTVVPSLAGPRRPQDRVDLPNAPQAFQAFATSYNKEVVARGKQRATGGLDISLNGNAFNLADGAVVIAAITSCTNTSNPAVLMAAGLVAKKAHEKGLMVKPWVKTSLAPGSQAVPAYLKAAGLLEHLEALNFHVTGFGCTTCIGNSGPLPEVISEAVAKGDLAVAAVLSGNRNFEGRINADVRTNWLASPPLVVAYALAGSMNVNLAKDPLGKGKDGKDVYLKDIWPTQEEVDAAIGKNVNREGFLRSYADVFKGDHNWQGLKVPTGDIYPWPDSSYIANPPYFDGMTMQEPGVPTIKDARVLVYVGDSITTDHISPAGSFRPDTPAGKYLQSLGVKPKDFNSFGSRRGNHEVMMRGTFANVRLKNKMAPGTEGGYTTLQPSGEQMFIYDAAMKYKAAGTPLVVLAGKEYGTGSSRDWAAKGTLLLGVQVVIAESYERIHRSNLVGMGVLPLQFKPGESAEGLGLTGKETFSIGSMEGEPRHVEVTATAPDGGSKKFTALVRIDTPNEWAYYKNGGILHYVLRNLARAAA